MADEWVIKTGIIKESKLLTVMMSMYFDLQSWFRQWKNISVQLVDIEMENFRRTLDEASPEGAEWLFFPCEMSLFSADRSPNSPRLSQAIEPTSTYMLSETPTKRMVPSMQFLNMQPKFVSCLLVSLMVISALMSVISCLPSFGNNSPRKRNFVHQFLDNLWRNILLFFFEPFIRPPRILSWRVVATVWLIAISFIYIDMCGNLKSKFAETEYVYFDSVANLPRNRYRDVVVVKDLVEEGFINKMAEIDDNYRELKNQMQRVEPEYFLFGDSPPNIVIIVAEFFAKIGMKEKITLKLETPPRGSFFFSEPLYSRDGNKHNTFVVFPIARNASSRTVDVINGLCTLQMEMKIVAKYMNEMDFWFFGTKWIKPAETFQDTTFGDIKSVVDLFVLGSLLAGLIFVVESANALVREALKFYRRG